MKNSKIIKINYDYGYLINQNIKEYDKEQKGNKKVMLENYRDVLTPRELKDILRIGFNKVYDLLKNGDIKSLKIGNKIIIPKTAVLKYLQTAA